VGEEESHSVATLVASLVGGLVFGLDLEREIGDEARHLAGAAIPQGHRARI